MSADEAMRGLSAIARADIRRLFDDRGRILPTHQWPDDTSLCVKMIRQKPSGTEVVLHDKLRALELVATAHGRLRRNDREPVFDLVKYLGAEPPPGDDERTP
jgi:hypothetical protein